MIALVTGASGGFGRVLAETLAGHGLTVYGTMRQPDAEAGALPFTMLAMEVTNAASVAACVQQIVDREGQLDVVVQCVNQMSLGSVEEQTVDEVQSLYDTNVFGFLRVCQAVLPVMRRQGRGTIIPMSSLGGLLAVPYMSAYTSAKFALEALGEALYHELQGTGIDVVIMQPVAMRIDRPALGEHMQTVAGVTPDSKTHQMVKRMATDTRNSGLTPEAVAEKVYQVIRAPRKPLRVPMDKARALGLVKRLAPQRVIDKLIRGLLPPD